MASSKQPATADDVSFDQSCHIKSHGKSETSSHDEGISMGSSTLSKSSNQKDAQEDVMKVMMSSVAEHFVQPDTKNREKVFKELKDSLNCAIVDIRKQASDKKPKSVATEDADSLLTTEDTNDSDDSTGSSVSPKSPHEAMNDKKGDDLLVLPNSSFPVVTEKKIKDLKKDGIDKDVEIGNNQNLLSMPIQTDLLLIVQNTGIGNDILMTYSLVDGKVNDQEISSTKKIAACPTICKMFYFNNKISLLIARLNNKTWKASVYQLDTDMPFASWKVVSHSNLSIPESQTDLENSIPISHKDDGVIIVSILNDRFNFNYRIVFHIFSKKVPGKKWILTSILLPQPSIRHAKYKILSCTMVSGCIHCSLQLEGVGARIYTFNLRVLQTVSVNIQPECIRHIKNDNSLENCFLLVHKGELIMICCDIVNNRSIIEVRRSKTNSSVVSTAEYRYVFPCKVKITVASTISDIENLVVAVIYHPYDTNKCYIKRIDMSHYCIK